MPQHDTGRASTSHSWAWIPTLYFAEGLPYALVNVVSVILYKALGISNAKIAFYTAWLALPWVIKPLWSPVVDILGTRRGWIWGTQLLLGAALGAIALTLPAPAFFQYSLAFLFLTAFASATHDIAADGYYMLALAEGDQSFFVGIRNLFYRVAMVFAQGLLVTLIGYIQKLTGQRVLAWSIGFAGAAVLLIMLGVYHRYILPQPAADRPGRAETLTGFLDEFGRTFVAFFRKPGIVVLLSFLLLYRFGEAQLVKMVNPFLLDAREQGGLGLGTMEVGVIYGIAGVAALLVGGIVGGMLVSQDGLRKWLWPMVIVMHLPDAVFVYLAYEQPSNLGVIGGCVVLEQFGYGFGFTAYMLYMIRIARGGHQTAHYAICTGFMALGLMLPGMWSGWVQEQLGYRHFFIWVLVATVPGFVATALIPLEAGFGKKTNLDDHRKSIERKNGRRKAD